MDKEYIYLDYAANTPVDPEILETFNKATLKYFANPNSTHELGQEVNKKIEYKESNKKYNQTVIIITHDEKIALEADRVITIDDGKIIKDGEIPVFA